MGGLLMSDRIRNTDRLEGMTPAAKAKVLRVLAILEGKTALPVDYWTVSEGLRTPERQTQLQQAGKSGLSGSAGMHTQGRAADIYPISNGQIPSYEQSPEAYNAYGEAAKGEGMTWGGDWTEGSAARDYGHIQYLRALATQKAARQRAMLQRSLSGNNEAASLGQDSEAEFSQ